MNGPYLLRDNVGASLVESDLLVMDILGSGLEAKDWVFTPLYSCCQGRLWSCCHIVKSRALTHQLPIFLPEKKDIERFKYKCDTVTILTGTHLIGDFWLWVSVRD